MVIGIVIGILSVFGIAVVLKAREREKQMEAMREADRQVIKKLKTLRFKTEI